MHEVSHYSSVSLENGGELCENVTYLGKNSCEALATHKGIVCWKMLNYLYIPITKLHW